MSRTIARFSLVAALLAGCGGSGACPTNFDPVCGNDGVTYANSCVAVRAGVGVAHAGECAPVLCLSDADCTSAQHCNHDRCLSGCPAGEACPAVCYGACEPNPGCFSDADCGTGFRCELASGPFPAPGPAPATPAGAGASSDAIVARPSGVCVAIETGCRSDTDCLPTEYCAIGMPLPSPAPIPPDMSGGAADRIAAPTGTCLPRDTGCVTDTDCAPGQYCDLGGGATPPADGAPIDPAIIARPGVCRDGSSCGGVACEAGYHCESTEECIDPPCDPSMGIPCTGACTPVYTCVRDIVPCTDDSQCLPEEHCELADTTPAMDPPGGIPAPIGGYCTPDPVCPDIACTLDCPAGLATDPTTGCSICECAPVIVYCHTDPDCSAGQVCDTSVCLTPCAPGETCPDVCWGQCIFS